MRSRTEGVGEVRPQRRPLTGCEAPAAASGTQPACLCASAQALCHHGKLWALAGRCNSAPLPEQPAVRAPPGMRGERLGRPAASRCGVSCTLLGSHSPQIAPRGHRKLWFWPAVAGPSQARWPRLGAHASPYAWASAGRGKACSLLYINALRYTPQNHPSTGGARFGSQSSHSYLHRVLTKYKQVPGT